MKKDLELQHHQIFEEIKQLDSYTDKATVMFTITQTEEKLKRDNIQGKTKANQTHYEVGKKVRETIKELGETMPEDLPTPNKSAKQIEKEKNKKLTFNNKKRLK